MSTKRVVQRTTASRAAVYRACLDPRAVAQWMVPDGMTSEVHDFDAREGGTFRISLTYDSPTETGKSSANTDFAPRVRHLNRGVKRNVLASSRRKSFLRKRECRPEIRLAT